MGAVKSYDYKKRCGVHQISWAEFHSLCERLAEKTNGDALDLIIGVARGGLFPATLVAIMLRKEFFPVRLTRRENDRVIHARPKWKTDIPDDVKGKRVLVIDDIVDSGETLNIVAERVKEKGAVKVTTATLATHSWADPRPDVTALVSDELLIFPWDTRIRTEEGWALHPELQKALEGKNIDSSPDPLV